MSRKVFTKVRLIIFLSGFLLLIFFLQPPLTRAAQLVFEPVTNPLGGIEVGENPEDAPRVLIGKVINGALGVVGSIALVIFIYAGIKWMTARGNADQVKKAQEVMLWAVLGLFMIFGSYVILNFIISNVK